MAEAQRRLWQDPDHRAKMLAARARSAEDRRLNPSHYSRLGVPDGMRKAEALEAWGEARKGADEYLSTLETQGLVANTTVPDSDDEKAKAALHELAKIALGPGRERERVQAGRILLAYTKALPEVRREIEITAESLLAQVQQLTSDDTSTTTNP
jgi:hypothetical protein